MGKSCWGKISRKGRYYGKKKIVTLVGFGFSQMWKISNAKATGSVVTSVLKKAVIVVIRQLLLWAKADEVN